MRFHYFLLCVLCGFSLLGCSRAVKEPIHLPIDESTAIVEQLAEDAAADEPPEEPAAPRFVLSAESARPGEPVSVGCFGEIAGSSGSSLYAALLDSKSRRLTRAAFFSLPGEEAFKAAILAVPSTALTGQAVIRIESEDTLMEELPFVIEKRDFPSETIQLNPVNTEIRTAPDPQKTEESELLWAIISRMGTEIHTLGPFIAPVTSTRRTSDYGSRRIYEYSNGSSDTTIHFGVDYGVPTGTDVAACAVGRVRLARERIVTGNTVILEHLPGVFSLYYHLDSIAVSEGSIADAGSILGKSGSTGLATGPHLHWEIRVATENADPDVFVSRPVLDKNKLINKIRDYE